MVNLTIRPHIGWQHQNRCAKIGDTHGKCHPVKDINGYPFLNCCGSYYITNKQEGTMFADFDRLYHAQRVNPGKKKNFYFLKFTKTSDFPNNNQVNFERKIALILNYYLTTNFDFLFTEGKIKKNGPSTVDVWQIKKPKISYFYFNPSTNNLAQVNFPPTPSFNLLYCDDSFSAFLIKVEF